MHDHDLDLIAAYADGTASADETNAASQLVSQCAECAEEYQAQIEALEVLASAGRPSMTQLERARLHSRLKSAVSDPKPEIGWFARYLPRVAAVAAGFAVVGFASVAMLGQGADESTDMAESAVQEIGNAEGATEATVTADGADLAGAAQEESLRLDDSVGDVMGADVAPAEPPTPTTRASSAPGPVTLDEDGLRLLIDSPIDDLVAFYGLPIESEPLPCSDELPESAAVAVSIASNYDGQLASVFVFEVDGVTVATALSVETCEVLAELTEAP